MPALRAARGRRFLGPKYEREFSRDEAIKPLEFDPDAEGEVAEAYTWYAKRSQRAADGFIAELDAALEAVQQTPARYAAHLHGTRRYLLKRYPYAVVYRELDVLIWVVAVAHGKRRPGYWRSRT
ncbi:MAG: type II toxin-antitoxin system RelE/ParE family toxin [Pirellulales bacterium]|nr:type II toxin-antitoxin system RelE/ParE family toxin [Pirellulales bacterium]